jgi:hypothetical protein
MKVCRKIVFVHAVNASGGVKVLLCSLLAVALRGWIHTPGGWVGPTVVFYCFCRRDLVSLPGIEPQFFSSPPFCLVSTLHTPPCLPSCSNVMYFFILIKWSDSQCKFVTVRRNVSDMWLQWGLACWGRVLIYVGYMVSMLRESTYICWVYG